MRRMLAQMGIEPQRLQLLWASAAEGTIFAAEVTKMVEEIRALGPLSWRGDGRRTTEDGNLPSSVVGHLSATQEVAA
jgi:F420-non-reducing hydrogenase iron-sulfur subunit